VALIFVDDKGENSIAVAPGANAGLTPEDVEEAEELISGANVVVMQLETPLETVERAATLACKHGARVILNPAPAQPLSDEILANVSILTPNESEAELLTGVPVKDDAGAEEAARALVARGVKTVILTLGSRGAFVFESGSGELVPGFKVDTVDTTAAGDVFNGTLAVGLAEGMPLAAAVRFANAAAALSVTRLGAQPSAPARSEIESFLTGVQ
jgi:ribokinase